MHPDDAPEAVRIEQRPVDERQMARQRVEKTVIGIEKQNPRKRQREIRNKIRNPAEKLDGVAARHVGARDQPREHHADDDRGNQTRHGKKETHPERADRRRIVKRAEPIIKTIYGRSPGLR